MEGRLLAKARDELAERRRQNRSEENRRREEMYRLEPELQKIDTGIRALIPELVGFSLHRSGRDPETLAQQNRMLQQRRRELLKKHGKSESYLDDICSCPLCGDNGYRKDGTMCACLKLAYNRQQTQELSPLLKNGEECFENFRLDYYSTAVSANSGTSPRQMMTRILEICRLYADSFGEDSKNLLFIGPPGLGKTFLSASIARVVAADPKGYSVAYDTAIGVLSVFEKEKFAKDEEMQEDAASRARQILGCDLLILDDLGAEMPTAFTTSAIYNLIDCRIRSGKKTIISTNLSEGEMTERYAARTVSRLKGEYLWVAFEGEDIRSLRKGAGR